MAQTPCMAQIPVWPKPPYGPSPCMVQTPVWSKPPYGPNPLYGPSPSSLSWRGGGCWTATKPLTSGAQAATPLSGAQAANPLSGAQAANPEPPEPREQALRPLTCSLIPALTCCCGGPYGGVGTRHRNRAGTQGRAGAEEGGGRGGGALLCSQGGAGNRHEPCTVGGAGVMKGRGRLALGCPHTLTN